MEFRKCLLDEMQERSGLQGQQEQYCLGLQLWKEKHGTYQEHG